MRNATLGRLGALMAVITLLGGVVLAQVDIETVPVGNPRNAPDSTGYGQVDYTYGIGKYEVTAGQYCDFLNAVAETDAYGLYNTNMWSSEYGCKIQQRGSAGSHSYTVDSDWAERPVNFVSWGDAARFANWLHNGQPTGTQGLMTTEDGVYYLNGATTDADLIVVNRRGHATWVIPTEDEWYKAAYHRNAPGLTQYYDYPTGSDSAPGYVDRNGNLSGTSTAFRDGITDPGNYATFNGDGESDGIGPPFYRTEVGEWENSGSSYGTSDQGGNVWEWNEAILGIDRGVRGGAFSDFPVVGPILESLMSESGVDQYSPTIEIAYVGFRVSRVPEPASMAVLALGSIGMLVKRRNLGR